MKPLNDILESSTFFLVHVHGQDIDSFQRLFEIGGLLHLLRCEEKHQRIFVNKEGLMISMF